MYFNKKRKIEKREKTRKKKIRSWEKIFDVSLLVSENPFVA